MPTPSTVQDLAGGDALRLVWDNELGGLTYEVGSGARRRFVKWAPIGSGVDLSVEAERLAWAVAFIPVPHVLGQGADSAGSWLVTSPIPGRMAVDDRWTAKPAVAVRAIGEGLRAMHDALPVENCPFFWQAEARVADARRRAGLGLIHRDGWNPDHQHLTIDDALGLVAAIPPIDDLVVCHGDACAPNTLLDDDGRWTGHVDLGALGVADRWADLAVATWSTTWNYGQGWELPLLEAYGIAPDPDRTRYYRLLWTLGP